MKTGKTKNGHKKRKLRHKRALIVVLIAILGVSGSAVYWKLHSTNNEEKDTGFAVSASIEDKESEETAEAAAATAQMDDLESELAETLGTYDGDWSVYVENLSTGETVTVNDHMSISASLIKLFVAGKYESMVESGELEATETNETNLKNMISISDNDAWTALETAIGMGSYRTGYQSVTQWARDNGYSSTGRQILEDGTWDAENGNNYTSVSDVGKVLEAIYNGTYVSADASARILELMEDQYWTEKIPAGVPDGVITANKTGELDTVQNDSAIVYGDTCDYVLVVMSQDITDTETAISQIVSISSAVYDYMEEE
jgi:beta-lactamase class A